jgi:hypothetical protein
MPKQVNYALRFLNSINSSKLVAGLAMIILNLFSKYVVVDLSKSQEAFIRNTITREILIFIVVFVGTKDILMSILITAAFTILSNTIFNEKSRFCMMPHKYKNLEKILDTNNDGYVSEKEVKDAEEILHKARLQKHKLAQINQLNYFQSNI